jgi:Tfp pilus assembly protein PilF
MMDDHRSAALTAERASESIPDAAEPWLTLALLRPDQARQYLANGLQHNPGDYRLTVDYARQLFREQDLRGAQQAYASALPIATEDPTVRTESAMLVEIAASQLSWDGAQLLMDVRSQTNSPETLRRVDGVVGQHPRSCLARVIRGNIHQIQGSAALAEADFQAALAISASSPEANSALGLLLLSQRRPDEAIAPLQIARQHRPNDVATALALSVALIEGQDPGTGGMVLLELVEQFPVHPGPPLALAQLLMKLGEPERAYQILLEASQRMPEPQVVLALAATAQAAGRGAEAAAAMRALGARTGDPRFEQAARQLFESTQE